MKFHLIKHAIFIISIFFLILLSSCKKEVGINLNPEAKLTFSTDTVLFDTVFTSLGSATKWLVIHNSSNLPINISDIRLAGGKQSPFRINVDGEPVFNKKNTILAGKDSLYVFARVTIDPNQKNNPFVVEDSILFTTNNNEQTVKLVAWGQNANYILADQYNPGFPPYKIVADSLQTTEWNSSKPYVIYGYAIVNSYGKLIISPGSRIYFHKNSGLWIYANGQLDASGTEKNKIIFQGDRLENDYQDVPGQWDRIWIMEGINGKNNIIKNAVIKNGFIGIQSESFFHPTKNKLILENVIIENMDGAGILSRNYNIEGKNMVVANCGGYCLALSGGGNYQFIQSTIANFWSFSVRNNPAVILTNFIKDNNNQAIPYPLNFTLGNSIIYGYNDNEFGTQMIPGADSNYLLEYCLIKTKLKMTNPGFFKEIIKNKDPLFKNQDSLDFRLDSLSPAIGAGSYSISRQAPVDILGNPRGQKPDLGAYQFIFKKP